MALYVNTNVSSLNAQRRLVNTSWELDSNYQHLASGQRINTAKDDCAGLQISEQLSSQINGLDQGNRNSNDGIALAQTIDGALDETGTMLQRIRTLAVQAANGTYTDADRETMQLEVTKLCQEISRIAERTTFGGAQVLDGIPADPSTSLINGEGKIDFQVGANSYDLISINLSEAFNMQGLTDQTDITAFESANIATAGDAFTGLISEYDATDPTKLVQIRWSVSNADAAQATLENIEQFISKVDLKRTQLGSAMNRMESTIRNYDSNSTNHSDSRSRMRDTDFAYETAELTQNNILQQATESILVQANQNPAFAVSLLQQ